jgi:hypothetical protein
MNTMLLKPIAASPRLTPWYAPPNFDIAGRHVSRSAYMLAWQLVRYDLRHQQALEDQQNAQHRLNAYAKSWCRVPNMGNLISAANRLTMCCNDTWELREQVKLLLAELREKYPDEATLALALAWQSMDAQ